MAADISISPNCDLGGVNIVAEYDTDHPTGVATVWRQSAENRVPVRNLYAVNVAVAGTSLAIVDTECPLDVPVEYQLVHVWGTGPTDYSIAMSPSITLNASCPLVGEFVVRNLFFQQETLILDAEVGTLQTATTTVRATEFPVIGRRDPVVVVDSVETERSVLRFIARNTTERKRYRTMFDTGDPLALQSVDVYGLGTDGVLYFMPKSVSEVRLTEDGTEGFRRFEVEYVRISAPPNAELLSVEGRTYQDVLDDVGLYSTLTSVYPTYYDMVFGGVVP